VFQKSQSSPTPLGKSQNPEILAQKRLVNVILLDPYFYASRYISLRSLCFAGKGSCSYRIEIGRKLPSRTKSATVRLGVRKSSLVKRCAISSEIFLLQSPSRLHTRSVSRPFCLLSS